MTFRGTIISKANGYDAVMCMSHAGAKIDVAEGVTSGDLESRGQDLEGSAGRGLARGYEMPKVKFNLACLTLGPDERSAVDWYLYVGDLIVRSRRRAFAP